MKELGVTSRWKYDTEAEVMRMGFRAKPDTQSGWVGWETNPVEAHMVRTRCLIAFRLANDIVALHTYNIMADNYATPPSSSPIDIPLSISALYIDADGHISIFATWHLSKSKSITNNSVHHFWQTAPGVDGIVPLQHSINTGNVNSKGTLDLKSGTSSVTTPSPNLLLKNIAKVMRHRSMAKALAGSVKEILGTCLSVGCTVDGKDPKDLQQEIDDSEVEIPEE